MRTAFVSLSVLAPTVPAALTADVPVLVVMPHVDRSLAERSARQLAGRAGADGLLLAVEDVDRQGFVAVVNAVFRQTSSTFVAYVAQDCYAGRGWLAGGVAALGTDGGLLGFNDGKWKGILAAFGLLRRQWAARNYGGELFFPGYLRHYADAELTVRAMADNTYRYDPHCVMFEVDWEKGRSAVNAADRRLYRRRAADGFDGKVQDPRLRALFS